ncbi:MAG TPA: hypothetical protein VFB78_10495 [Acidimicrobiales bacterium]|nr:hypothetical protein [Acidimicrobiales bacterium]
MTKWIRRALVAFLGGTLVVSAAWAGVGLKPAPKHGTALPIASRQARAAAAALAAQQPANPLSPPDLKSLTPLPEGQFLVGATVTSLAPNPKLWQTKDCALEDPSLVNDPTYLLERAAAGHIPPGWPKSPNCVYLGGYGIGPARVGTSVDPYAGYNVRSVAISNGRDTVVWQIIDAVGYFAKYRADLCPDCGMLDMRRRIAGAIGMPISNVAIGATHTHAGMDGYGAWGGLPDWYRTQVRDAVIASAYEALRTMKPAQIEIGDVNARAFSGQRRDTYYSANDFGAVWLQARRLAGGEGGGNVIATLVNYAAHPTMLGDQSVMHGDWPGTADKALGDRLGGVGLVFEGGLGNVSPNSPRGATSDLTGDKRIDGYDNVIQMGTDFASFVAGSVGKGGHVLVDNTIATTTKTVLHPATNVAEVPLSFVGLLDREFTPGTDGAGAVGVWVSDTPGAFIAQRCVTGSAVLVKTEVSGYRIGDLLVITAPGEIFGSISTVVKSQLRRKAMDGGETMVFGQTQDSLGYIIQSYEVDPVGGAPSNIDTMGFGDVAEYEEEFMLDRCFGDHVLETMLSVGRGLG